MCSRVCSTFSAQRSLARWPKTPPSTRLVGLLCSRSWGGADGGGVPRRVRHDMGGEMLSAERWQLLTFHTLTPSHPHCSSPHPLHASHHRPSNPRHSPTSPHTYTLHTFTRHGAHTLIPTYLHSLTPSHRTHPYPSKCSRTPTNPPHSLAPLVVHLCTLLTAGGLIADCRVLQRDQSGGRR